MSHAVSLPIREQRFDGLGSSTICSDHADLSVSTKRVFDCCSAAYLDEDTHWASDELQIRQAITASAGSILDAGCGPGWHLVLLAEIASPGTTILGIDYSEAMLRLARDRLRRANVTAPVQLRLADLRDVAVPRCSFGVALCLNNTLGNIVGPAVTTAAIERARALRTLHRALAPGGVLVISVYWRAALVQQESYGRVFSLDHELSSPHTGDLVVRYRHSTSRYEEGVPYYSHWFTTCELQQLLEEAGFVVNELETRGQRICASAEVRQS